MSIKVAMVNTLRVDPDLARKQLGEIGAQVVVADCKDEDEVIRAARDADAILRAGGQFTRRVIQGLERCRIISCYAIDIDGIDLDAATEKGICVAFAPDVSTEEVSDHAMAMVLALARKLFPYDSLVKAGRWTGASEDGATVYRAARPLLRLKGMTLGTVGFGRAGQALARRAQAFDMRVLAYDPKAPREAGVKLGVELATLDAVLRESDFLCVNVPLTSQTRHMIGMAELRKMRPTAYLVNCTARAAIVDEEALHQALTEKVIAGAGLDNLERHPFTANPLARLDNVIITPHVGHVSEVSEPELQRRICGDVIRFFKGEWPPLVANEKVKQKVQLKAVVG